MFIKTIDPCGWDGLRDQGITHIVPISSRGLADNDRKNFLYKTAASEKFVHEIGNIKLAEGDIPVHINAIGAGEVYSANRKGDAFSEQTCKDWHHTFVSEGKNYIHHLNRDPDYNFGKVASSCYNDKMKRIELLVVSNGSEAAAKRNGGHVLPDEFLSKLEKNAEVPVSMGCVIKHDTCSICGNKARTRSEYCDETTCRDPKTGEYFPGCKTGLMKIAADGRQQYVDNIEPHFFDISYVGVPADRTGYGFRADYMSKTAAAIPADTILTPIGLDSFRGAPIHVTQMRRVLDKLAAYEQLCSTDPVELSNAYGVFALPSDISLGNKLAAYSEQRRLGLISYLADNGVILSPDSFSTAFNLGKTAAADIRANSSGVYRRLYPQVYLPAAGEKYAAVLSQLQSTFGKTAASYISDAEIATYRISPDVISSGVSRGAIVLGGGQVKTAAVAPSGVADTYAIYKAAALCCFPSGELRDYGIRYAVWQTMLPVLAGRLGF
jgi:hypothetical protein